MIFRDLYRCPPDHLHQAVAGSEHTVVHRGVVGPASALPTAALDRLVIHPAFDPSLGYLAYEGGKPVAFLTSRLETDGGEREAVWSLFGSLPDAGHACEELVDQALGHWRAEGVRRVRQGPTALLGTEPQKDGDGDGELLAALREHGFEVEAESVRLVAELKALAAPAGLAERERELRSRGYYVRDAHADEVAVVARQFHPRHTGELSLEFWNEFVRHLRQDALLVGEFRRQVCAYVGYLGWTLERERPVLGPCFVEAPHRDAQLGDLLHHRALAAAKEAGKAGVEVHCPSEAAGAYERVGFRVAARYCARAVAELA